MLLKNQFGLLSGYFKRIKKLIIIMTILLIVFSIATSLICYYGLNDNEAIGYYSDISEGITDGGVSNDIQGIWYYLFQHNMKANFYLVFMGLVPFLFLPVFNMLVNALILGAVCALAGRLAGISPLNLFVFGVLPHGIFELSALVICAAVGFDVCFTMCRMITKKTNTYELNYVLTSYIRVLIMVVLPLLLIAGLIEGLLTPAIIARAFGY